jgi:hypothetical protein
MSPSPRAKRVAGIFVSITTYFTQFRIAYPAAMAWHDVDLGIPELMAGVFGTPEWMKVLASELGKKGGSFLARQGRGCEIQWDERWTPTESRYAVTSAFCPQERSAVTTGVSTKPGGFSTCVVDRGLLLSTS